MAKSSVLDFRAQADQMINLIENRLKAGKRQQAMEFLILKYKALYDQGVASGRLYEREGVYPYRSIQEDSHF